MDYTEILVLLWIVILVVGIVVYIVTFPRKRRKLIEILESIAIKRGGKVSKPSFRLPSLKFNYKNRIVSLRFYLGSKYSPPQTIVSATTTFSQDLEMYIFKEGKMFDILKKVGVEKEVEIGSDYFDSRFVIKGNNQDMIRDLLDYRIQEKIIDAEHLSPIISLDNGEIEIKVNTILEDETSIEKLINLVTSMIDRLDELNR